MIQVGGRSGFVLPAVLGVLLIISVISFAMSLIATLELLSARSAADAVAAKAAADGALALALREAGIDLAGGPPAAPDARLPAATYGPWSHHQIDGSATLQLLGNEADDPAGLPPVYRLSATATVGRALSTVGLVFTLEPHLLVLERLR